MLHFFLKLTLASLLICFVSSCASKVPLHGVQSRKSKKKDKEKPRPKPLPKIYRPKMMADEPEDKTRKPSNDRSKAEGISPLCGSDKSCR